MHDQKDDHVAAGWNSDHTFRWIEAGRIRLDEDDHGASATFRAPAPSDGAPWLSANELAGLVRHLARWFADDPTPTIRQIEKCADYVRTELEAWNDRARADEEHPPYDELTRALGALLGECRSLREVLGRFADAPKIITVADIEEGAEGADA